MLFKQLCEGTQPERTGRKGREESKGRTQINQEMGNGYKWLRMVRNGWHSPRKWASN